MKRSVLCVLLGMLIGLAAVCAAPSVSMAQNTKKQSVASLIKKGQAHFDEQLYEESIQVLSAALMRPGIAVEEKIKVYQLLAYNYIVLNREDEGEGAVFGLLAQDPEYKLPESESPRFREFFEASREKWEAAGRPGFRGDDTPAAPSVKIKHTSPAQVDAGMAISLTGSIDDPKAAVSKVRIQYRTGSSGKFTTGKVKFAMRKFSVDIPSDAVEAPIVEYYIEALDNNGLPVANRGDADVPLRIAVAEPSGGVFTSPWFWIPVGVAVVAAVVIPIVIVSTSGTSDATVRVNVFEN